MLAATAPLLLAQGRDHSPQRRSSDLESRFASLSCAVVQIFSEGSQGTGFFVNPDGDLVTAAHVILSTSYSKENNDIRISVTPRSNLRIRGSDGHDSSLTFRLGPEDASRATADLAIIRTGLKTPCYLRIGDPGQLKIGNHLIALGYPALDPTIALYDGFLSSRHTHLPIPVGYIGSQPVYPMYEVLRIQMPITPGASGSPVVADDDSVVGVISEVPVLWSEDLSRLIQAMMASPQGSGILLSGFDTTKLLGQLAWIVHEFESPGAGLAVPVTYLELPGKTTRRP